MALAKYLTSTQTIVSNLSGRQRRRHDVGYVAGPTLSGRAVSVAGLGTASNLQLHSESLPRSSHKSHISISAFSHGIKLYFVYLACYLACSNLLALANVVVGFVYGFTTGCQKSRIGLLSTFAFSYGMELYFAYIARFNLLALLKVTI